MKEETHQQDSLVPPSGHSNVCTRHTKREVAKRVRKVVEEEGPRIDVRMIETVGTESLEQQLVKTDLAADQQGCFLCSTGKEREIHPITEVVPCIEEHVKHVIEKDRNLSISV